MAFNFDSGQFNRESTPKRLGNWEVPRWAPTRARPMEMRPNPKPISDLNGHFLPGAPRGTSRCFGHFVGTWDLPKKITREVAAKLAQEPPAGRFPDWLNPRVQRPKAKAPIRVRGGKRGKTIAEVAPSIDEQQKFKDTNLESDKNEIAVDTDNIQEGLDNNVDKDVVNDESLNDVLDWNKQKKPIDSDGHGPYIPGSLTDPEKRHDSYDLLVQQAIEDVHGPQEHVSEKFWRKVNENAKNNDFANNKDMKKDKHCNDKLLKLPQVNVSQHFQFARKMHVDNLEHQPLPDTLGYRHLTKIAEHRDSDIIVKPYAIGWKGYGASGPTSCTKMRVHRPKTCDPKKPDVECNDAKQRPSTSVLDLGRVYKKPMSKMDLAICWDFRPDDPKGEPKLPKHIDGSNGSKAPAVFTMVHTPKHIEEIITSGHSNPIFNQNRLGEDQGHHSVPYFEKDMTQEKRKDSCDVQYCPQHKTDNGRGSNSSSASRKKDRNTSKPQCDGIHGCGTPSEDSRKSNPDYNRPHKLDAIKEAWTVREDKPLEKNALYDAIKNRNSIESYDKTSLAQGKLCQSSPNKSQSSRRSTKESLLCINENNNIKHRHCISCNGTSKPILDTKPKDSYKSAFKAGNPNSVQSSNSTQDSKTLKIPKMRHPYTKKSYSIPTLAPPFSIWRDANANGYPEHWRLASVYQHAFKPLEQRRKALISSVYQ